MDLSHRSHLLAVCHSMAWRDIASSWKGIGNYPLGIHQKQFLRNHLFCGLEARLWLIRNACVFIYRWPNNQLRFFLADSSGHLYECSEGASFYRYFPFIEPTAEGFSFHYHNYKVAQISDTILWMPQNSNYSHFMCDYYAPAIAAKLSAPSHVNGAQLLTVQNWEPWQQELIQSLGLGILPLEKIMPGELVLARINKVVLPVIEHPNHSQHILRHWFAGIYTSASGSLDLCDCPVIYMTRSGPSSMRIRNTRDIEALVEGVGGVCVDPSTLSFEQKLKTFQSSKILIGDGSATINAALFMHGDSHLIALTDPLSLANDDFLLGGFPYLDSISERTSFVIGTNAKPLDGSPLSSAIYPLSVIRRLIKIHSC